MSNQTVHGVCGICDAGCSVHVVVEDGVLKQVKPRNGHPYGSCCIRLRRISRARGGPSRRALSPGIREPLHQLSMNGSAQEAL